jgi:uncharacterized cupin superfamily protein
MSSETTKNPCLFRAADHEKAPEQTFSHPFNPKSEIHGRSLGDSTGLQRIGVHLLRIPPGKESFIYHRHYGEEEFVYVLSGRGVAEIDGQELEIGPGDFMGFPTPSVGHHLRNPFDQDFVYLSGGERKPMEVAEFPTLGKRMVRVGMALSITKIEGEEVFPGFAKLGEKR